MSSRVDWSNNPNYQEKRGICDHCGQRDDLKLSYDQHMYICKNMGPCMLRWRKKVAKNP